MDLLWGGDGDGDDEEEYVAVLFESSGTHIVLLLYYYLLLCCFSGRLPIRLSHILRIIGLTCYAATRKGERERDSPPIYQEASVFFSRSVTVFMQQRCYLLEYPFE